METLKSLMTRFAPLLVQMILGSAPSSGAGFSQEKLVGALRTAGMTFVAVGSLAALGVLNSVDYGVLEGASVALLVGVGDYIKRHFKSYLPPAVPAE